MMYQMATRNIREELNDILEKLEAEDMSEQDRSKLGRRLWVLRGILDYDLNMTALNEIAARFESLDQMP